VPTVGTVVAVGLLLLALVRRNEALTRASLEVMFLVALTTLPVYLTGVAAEAAIVERPGVVGPAIDAHEAAALVAFMAMQFTGFAAWLALWHMRRRSVARRASLGAAVVLAIATLALMARAAAIGGEIRHPEIVVGLSAASGAQNGWLTSAAIGSLVTNTPWVWPAAETVHFIGLCVVVGVLISVNLRILGAMKALPFAAVHRLLPWGALGFAVNLVTGMLFFIAADSQYTSNVMFFWKTVFLMIAGANFLYLTVVDETWALQSGEDAGALDKAIAVASLASWVGVIYAGRMLPFLGNAF
jgi:hypothetical protein